MKIPENAKYVLMMQHYHASNHYWYDFFDNQEEPEKAVKAFKNQKVFGRSRNDEPDVVTVKALNGENSYRISDFSQISFCTVEEYVVSRTRSIQNEAEERALFNKTLKEQEAA